MIYVFDITTTEWESDLKYFDEILTALRENSSDAGVWVLINKMDLVDKEDPKRKKYSERKEEIIAIDERIRRDRGEGEGSLRCFPTSIWDESLYKVSSIGTTRLTTGVVFGDPYADTEHRPHYLSSDVAAKYLPGDRSGGVRGGNILGHCQVWLGVGQRHVRDGRPREGVRRAGAGPQAIREDLRDDQRVQEDVPVSCTRPSDPVADDRRTGEAFTGFEARFDECTAVLEPLTQNTFILIVAADPRVGECIGQAAGTEADL